MYTDCNISYSLEKSYGSQVRTTSNKISGLQEEYVSQNETLYWDQNNTEKRCYASIPLLNDYFEYPYFLNS